MLTSLGKAFKLRDKIRVIPMKEAGSLDAPSLNTEPLTPEWNEEVPDSDISEDTNTLLSNREMITNPITKLIKSSKKLVNGSSIPLHKLVAGLIGEAFAVAHELAVMKGTGNGQPLGIFVPSSKGIDTDRDIISASAASITYDDVLSLKKSLKAKYDKIFIAHPDVTAVLCELVDNNGNPVWKHADQDGDPDRLLGIPVFESDYAPASIAADQYTVAIGDLNYYWWTESQETEVDVIKEMFSLKNQYGYIGYMEADGAPVKPEAFARLKMKAV